MRYYRNIKKWLGFAILMAISEMMLISCQTDQRTDQTKNMEADVRILSRIGRAINRYRAALDLTSLAQSAVERSLADRHWSTNRDILRLEFAQAKLELDDLAAQKEKDAKADRPESIQQQDQNGLAEMEQIRARVEEIKKRVDAAEQKLNGAKSARIIEQAQAELKRAQQRLKIGQKELALSEANLKLAEMQQKETDSAPGEITALKDKVLLFEKEILQKDGADASPVKWSAQENARESGIMGAFRSWWSFRDKGQSLDKAEQRIKRTLEDFKNAQLENQKLQERMQAEHRTLNQEMQQLYMQANELLKKPEQSEAADNLLAKADSKMSESLAFSLRREKIGRMQEIFQQKLLLATDDDDSLANWIQVVADSRGRALTRLLQQAGSLIGILTIIFLLAYFAKKIPSRFVKEEKSAYYFRKLIGFITWLIVILIIIFNTAGGIGSISAVIGLAGAGLAIALQDPIVSLVGWFLIIGKYGIRVGNRIEISGVKGDVADVGMLRIAVMEVGNWLSGEQSTGRMVFFPNSFIFKGHFFNYSTSNPFIWDEIHILVTYESPWKKALDIIVKVAEKASEEATKRARDSQEKLAREFNINLGSPDPYAYVTIADSGVDLVLRFLTEIKLRRVMRDNISREILQAFEKEKDIQLAYPTQRQLTETRIINSGSTTENS